MEKAAKCQDIKQMALRDHKKQWNIAAKEFIKRLISFKKGLNGRGDNSFSLPTSNIKDPLPSEVISFLSEVSSNFEQLASEALKITREQQEYSQNRRKPIEKKPENTPNEAPGATIQ